LNTNSFVGTTTSINKSTIVNLLAKGYIPTQLTSAGFVPSIISRFSYTIINNVITAPPNVSGTGTTYAVIPDSVTSTSNSIFLNNTVITEIICTGGSLLNQFGTNVFQGCTNLTNVTLSSTSLKSISASCFSGCTALPNITIPSAVTLINTNAFQNCTGLSSVTLNCVGTSTVLNTDSFIGTSSINDESVRNLLSKGYIQSQLTNAGFKVVSRFNYDISNNVIIDVTDNLYGTTIATIPDSVTSIADGVFSDIATVITEFICTGGSLLNNLGINVFDSCNKLTSVTLGTNLKLIGLQCFTGCSKLPSITIPNAVTLIDQYAFENCAGLTSITLPNSLTSIGSNCFYTCTALLSITLPNLLTSIGDSCFNGCTALLSITLPTSLTSIGSSCFDGCSKLSSITIPSAVILINTNTFRNCIGLTSVTLNCIGTSTVLNSNSFVGTTTSINKSTMVNLLAKGYTSSQLTTAGFAPSIISRFSYDISNNVITFVADSGTGTTYTVIPDSVTSTSNSLFLNNTVITEFICTSGSLLNQFGISCFSGCSNLTNVTLNTTNLTLISTSCFSGCSLLLGVIIPISVTSIGNSCFSGCTALPNITIPSAVTLIDTNAFQNCTGLTSVTLNCAGTSTVLNTNSFIGTTSINQTTINNLLEKGYNPLQLTNAGFTIISRFTYDISNNVIIAVYDSGVGYTFTIIDDSVTGVADSIFQNNVFVTSFICTGSSLLNRLGSSVFQACTNLTNVTIPNSVTSFGTACFSGCAALPNITLPNSLESIVFNCFLGCSSLTSITIPNSVSFIGTACFSGCSSLSSITFSSSVESISNNSFSGCSSLISVTIPSTITLIESYAFRNCTGLTSVTLNSAGKSTRLNTNSFLDTTSMSRTTVTNLLAKGYTQPQLTNAGFIAPPAPANPSSLSYTYY
jgi:hypothetical protein